MAPASDAGVVAAAVVGVAVAAGLWWLSFDVVALFAARRLAQATAGREARDRARHQLPREPLPH